MKVDVAHCVALQLLPGYLLALVQLQSCPIPQASRLFPDLLSAISLRLTTTLKNRTLSLTLIHEPGLVRFVGRLHISQLILGERKLPNEILFSR